MICIYCKGNYFILCSKIYSLVIYIMCSSFLHKNHFAFSFFAYICTQMINKFILMRKILFFFVAFLAMTTSAWSEEPVARKWYFSLLPHIKTEVKPLLTTRWEQGSPYNNNCPVAPSSSNHCLTGCVATAMAQVMRFYQYPDKGKGNVNYWYRGDDGQQHNVEVDFSKSTYQWNLIKDSYTISDHRTADEKEAVAQLMADCGAAVQMQYSEFESGAFDMDVANAMVNHFGYDPSIKYMGGFDECSDSLWFCTLYEQLSEGRPVIYGGVTESYGAHSFVVDGYDKEGRFHVVYGLGGGDGFYDLNKIRYRYGRSMTVNIRPLRGTGINSQKVEDMQPKRNISYYTIDGLPTKSLQKGINIIRTKDNKARKVIVE